MSFPHQFELTQAVEPTEDFVPYEGFQERLLIMQTRTVSFYQTTYLASITRAKLHTIFCDLFKALPNPVRTVFYKEYSDEQVTKEHSIDSDTLQQILSTKAHQELLLNDGSLHISIGSPDWKTAINFYKNKLIRIGGADMERLHKVLCGHFIINRKKMRMIDEVPVTFHSQPHHDTVFKSLMDTLDLESTT